MSDETRDCGCVIAKPAYITEQTVRIDRSKCDRPALLAERDGLKKSLIFWKQETIKQNTEIRELKAERDALRERVAILEDSRQARIDDIAKMQKHRDTWRAYAYGLCERPKDFIDGNFADDPSTRQTLIEKQAAEIERLNAISPCS